LHESYQFFKAPFELDESLYLIEFLEEFKMMNPVRIIVPVNKTMLVSTWWRLKMVIYACLPCSFCLSASVHKYGDTPRQPSRPTGKARDW